MSFTMSCRFTIDVPCLFDGLVLLIVVVVVATGCRLSYRLWLVEALIGRGSGHHGQQQADGQLHGAN